MSNKTAILALVIAILSLVMVIVRPSLHKDGQAKPQTVFEHVMQTHTIRCGYAVWNPVLVKDPGTGEMHGIARDVIEAVGKKLDLKIEWAEEVGWSTVVEGLATHRYDMICNPLSDVPARAKVIDFSVPFFYLPMFAVVRGDEQRFTHNEELNNPTYSFSTLDGEAVSYLLPEQFPLAQVKHLPQNADFTLVLEDVATKKADATLITPPDFVEYDKTNPGKLKLLGKTPIGVYSLSFGLPQGDVAMKTMIDAALNELGNEGTLDKMIDAASSIPGEFMKPAKQYAPVGSAAP